MSSPILRSAVPTTGFSKSGIAPGWHTLVVLFLMLGVSLLGARLNLRAVFGMHGRLPSYLLIMVIEWATVAFIWWGLNRRGIRLSDLIGGSWARGIEVLRDFGIGIAFIVIFGGAVQALTSLLKVVPPERIATMMPQTRIEAILWVLVSLTGGFCEEVIFRGYLQRQFSAFTKSLAAGIVLQGIVFGLSHGYQGWKMMSLIALYGVCFGLLAYWRHSLRPGIIGHAFQDTAGGLLTYFTAH